MKTTENLETTEFKKRKEKERINHGDKMRRLVSNEL
jgi:hypothetical protein